MATSREKKDNNVTFLSGAVRLSLFWYLWVGNTYRQVVFFFATYFEKQKQKRRPSISIDLIIHRKKTIKNLMKTVKFLTCVGSSFLFYWSVLHILWFIWLSVVLWMNIILSNVVKINQYLNSYKRKDAKMPHRAFF